MQVTLFKAKEVLIYHKDKIIKLVKIINQSDNLFFHVFISIFINIGGVKNTLQI